MLVSSLFKKYETSNSTIFATLHESGLHLRIFILETVCWIGLLFSFNFNAGSPMYLTIRFTKNMVFWIAGINDSGHSVLRRMNTCTTYISVRRKTNGNHTAPARSASIRNDSFRPVNQPLQRQLVYLESHTEEQL